MTNKQYLQLKQKDFFIERGVTRFLDIASVVGLALAVSYFIFR